MIAVSILFAPLLRILDTMPAGDYYLPHSMIVNRHGRRFVNEKDMNFGLAFDERHPDSGEPLHQPAWRIYDSQFASKYGMALPKTSA